MGNENRWECEADIWERSTVKEQYALTITYYSTTRTGWRDGELGVIALIALGGFEAVLLAALGSKVNSVAV